MNQVKCHWGLVATTRLKNFRKITSPLYKKFVYSRLISLILLSTTAKYIIRENKTHKIKSLIIFTINVSLRKVVRRAMNKQIDCGVFFSELYKERYTLAFAHNI